MKNNAYNKVPSFKRVEIYYKILLIGPRKVGKTQILKRICKEDFNEKYSPSFGVDFRIQKYYSENLVVQIIELSEKNQIAQDIIKEYIIEADCFICIYDITNINSVRELSLLVNYCEEFIPNDNKKQCWYFVGNKSDDKNRECTNRPENLFNYVPYGNIGFIEISAKENKSVDIMFRNAIMRINDLRKIKGGERNDMRSKGKNHHNRNISPNNNDEIINSEKRLKDIKKENTGNNDKIDKIDEKEENKKCEIF